MQQSSAFEGTFEFKPLEPGFGVTIGNALRRILLSSLEGYAITSIRIPGVDHEFSTIKGVVEDVVEIILNLKQIRFRSLDNGQDSERIYASVKGKTEITAGDLGSHCVGFEVLNPDLVICHVEHGVTFDMELNLEKGRGYVPSEENKNADANLGVIPIDSIFTPIVAVNYSVENTRVEQKTDYEKLIISVRTDGSINPEEALKQAANILIQHFVLFSDESITLETKQREVPMEVDENTAAIRKLLKTSLADLDLSVRAFNCLKAAEIRTLGDLVKFEIADLLRFRNFGRKSLTELEELVREKGLTFGFDVARYRLDED
jgi:DNA-directed RNA polymerase subunit alpha